jgi:sulfhydrogenase subunit delta
MAKKSSRASVATRSLQAASGPRPRRRPKLAVWKFASCDGCQLTLLDCEDELLELTEYVEIANFPEASRRVIRGPYDLSLVEGSITTPHDAKRIQEVRASSKMLVTIGACATSGGIQALRNYAKLPDYTQYVYAKPEWIDALATSTPISAHVKVDFELQGCPINKAQLIELLISTLQGKRPNIPTHSECVDCKLKGNVCVMVTQGVTCLGPITHAGCGAICPSMNRGCYGCYGPKETANPLGLGRYLKNHHQKDPEEIKRALRSFYSGHPLMKKASEDLDE